MKNHFSIILSIILLIVKSRCQEDLELGSHLPTVDYVDLDEFSGTWYEIARLPVWDEIGCLCTKSTYNHLPDNSINVLHECIKGGVHGRLVTATGKGRPLDNTNSKLRFDYYWPFWTLNYVIELDKDYEWALIGHPNRNHLWIFSRCPELEEKTYKKLVDRALELDFPVQRLIKTYHGNKCIYVEPISPFN